MAPTTTVLVLAAAAGLVAVLATRSAMTEAFEPAFEPVGTCWKDVKGSFEVKRILWAAQTLAWRIMGHLLTHHADSPFTTTLLRQSKLELRLPTKTGAGIVDFDAATGCVTLNLDHPAVRRVPGEMLAAVRVYAANVSKAVLHALASVHGPVGTAAHNKAYDFYATVVVDEMAGPRHVLTKLVSAATAPPSPAPPVPARCAAAAKNPARFAECCAAKALRDQVDDACSKPFTY